MAWGIGYLELFARRPRVLGFGFSCGVTSSFGQTFFISFFVGPIAAAFAVDTFEIGSLYSACTVASAICMPWLGRFIDRIALHPYVVAVGAALTAGLLGMSAADSLVVLGIALFLTRMCGQGLMTHIEVTSIARFFERSRGKALGLVSQGHAAGEGVLPLLFHFLLDAHGWRATLLVAAGMAAGATVLHLGLLGLRDTRPDAFVDADDRLLSSSQNELVAADERVDATVGEPVSWTRGQVLRQVGFWALMPFWLGPALILTGTIFHQSTLAAEKGWDEALVAASFTLFAICRSAGGFAVGPLIDWLGARRVFPTMIAPLAIGLLPLALGPSSGDLAQLSLWAPWYFGWAGITVGMAPVRSAWLCERFGTEHLGAIRSSLFALAVLATAVCPPLFGYLLKMGIDFATLVLGIEVYLVVAVVAVVWGLAQLDGRRPWEVRQT